MHRSTSKQADKLRLQVDEQMGIKGETSCKRATFIFPISHTLNDGAKEVPLARQALS